MSRILVVEDDFDLRFLYANVLTREGHEVVGSPSTLDAMLRLTNEDFDAVVLDMNMPDIPGLKVVEFMHGDVRLRKIPIIIVSANEHWREKTYPLGVRHFLVKPVPMRELQRVVKDALSR